MRLSPTFRFEGDGLTLDLPSHAWVEELAEQVSSGRYDGRTLLLAGFSDGQGPSDANRAMSGAGAEEVMAALVGVGEMRGKRSRAFITFHATFMASPLATFAN